MPTFGFSLPNQMIEVEVTNNQTLLEIDEGQLKSAVVEILKGQDVTKGVVSLAVVDGPAIHALNARWLEHDYPTDVLSFLIEREDDHLEGEVIVSADMALEMAPRYGWPPQAELLLYVVHGCLHLVGYDDSVPHDQQAMRERERHYLAHFGFEPSYDDHRSF